MKRFLKMMGGLLLAASLAACGGGGGSSGSSGGGGVGGGGGGSGGGTPDPSTPTVTLSLVNASGGAVSGNAVTSGTAVFARATLRNADGDAVPNKLVDFSSANGVIGFTPASGQVLTDAAGSARVQLNPTSLQAAGADTITVSATIDTVPVSAAIDVQTSAANVSLDDFTAAQRSLSAYEATTVAVDVLIDGSAATGTAVPVSFTSSCGSFSPATAASDSSGRASTTFQANGCTGGTTTLTASATGATSVQTRVNIQAPKATNLLFVSASPSTIYTSGASSGVKQSTVVFRVVDAGGNPVGTSTAVRISLAPTAIAAGVVFADTNSTSPKVVSSNAAGEVSVLVKSGGFPTPLSLSAELVDNATITAASSGLSVDSGRGVQNFFSISASKTNIEGGDYDGITTTLTVRAADRLGQPVPAGTPISFITEGGQVSASCTLGIDTNGKSGCSVVLASQDFRPSNGRVTVLAYMDGDEIFVDENGNNRYDAGETFYDMGQPFLDVDEDDVQDSANDQKVGNASTPGSGIGTRTCPAHANQVSNVAGTCDGQWGATRIRARQVIVFSGSFADTSNVYSDVSTTSVDVLLRDGNGNAMPEGSTLSATVANGQNCSVLGITPARVNNSLGPTRHRVLLGAGDAAGDTCFNAVLNVSVTTPIGNVTPLGRVTLR